MDQLTKCCSEPPLRAPAVKLGLAALSEGQRSERLSFSRREPESSQRAIRSFRNQKAEQNAETLAQLLGPQWSATVEQLVRIGFLEKLTESWKVPILYRDDLNIIQGSLFSQRAWSTRNDGERRAPAAHGPRLPNNALQQTSLSDALRVPSGACC